MAALERHWYRLTPVSVLLLPLSLLFCLVVLLRRLFYRVGLLRSYSLPVPVIVVGNITVGGTGKTPLVVWLADVLRDAGYRPGVVTRGYRGRSPSWPLHVTSQTPPQDAGDEAVLLARRAHCPVVAGPDRVAGARQLVALGCNVIVSDDGLQHYRLRRDIEIAVIDGARRTGNNLCLPAGPLREPRSRLQAVDARVTNGMPHRGEFGVTLEAESLYSLTQPELCMEPGSWKAGPVHAVAGIGHPERFFATLRGLGIALSAHPYPDHHDFQPLDLDFGDDRPVIMTEKDAVKCRSFARPDYWALSVSARPGPGLREHILKLLGETKRG